MILGSQRMFFQYFPDHFGDFAETGRFSWTLCQVVLQDRRTAVSPFRSLPELHPHEAMDAVVNDVAVAVMLLLHNDIYSQTFNVVGVGAVGIVRVVGLVGVVAE